MIQPGHRYQHHTVTGSIGILLKAKSMGYPVSMPDAISRMRERGISYTHRRPQSRLRRTRFGHFIPPAPTFTKPPTP